MIKSRKIRIGGAVNLDGDVMPVSQVSILQSEEDKRRKERDTATRPQKKRECPRKGYLYRCPICANEVEGDQNPIEAQNIIDGADNLAHAERLAEACRRMIDSPNNFDARQKCMDAFAQWKGRK
jgi:hypothetical protein